MALETSGNIYLGKRGFKFNVGDNLQIPHCWCNFNVNQYGQIRSTKDSRGSVFFSFLSVVKLPA